MKHKNRTKRVADMLEKLGVAGFALAIFQGNYSAVWFAVLFLIVSILITKED